MDNIHITDMQGWQLSAPDRPPDNPALLKRLSDIKSSPLTSGANENITTALHNLLSLGFIVETQSETPSSSTSLAHHIAQTLLNFSIHHGTPSPYEFSLRTREHHINIPSRSSLLLLHLSHLLRINIFVFSSRAKPKAFTYPESTSSIAYFHRIDSYHGTSEYNVLAPSSHITTPPARVLPPPRVFTSPVQAARFREDKRSVQEDGGGKQAFPDLATCREALGRVCVERVHSDIEKAVKDIMSKKRMKAGETRESLLADKQRDLKREMLARTKTPRFIVQNLHTLLTQEQDLDPSFDYVHLRTLLDDGNNIASWKQSVQMSFDEAWENTLEAVAEETTSNSNNPKAKNKDEERIRTCTVTLKQILHPDLAERYTELTSIAQERQTDITNTVDELSILIQKSLLVLASGALYSHNPKQDPFDIKSLFPPRFMFRADVSPLVNVAPLPPHLQRDLQAGLTKPRSQDDFAHFLSQDYIQFLHSRFLSPRREHNVSNTEGDKHETWCKAAEIIRQSSSTANIPFSPTGMSTTINEHIRLLSTAVGNLWTGSVYKKALDYLLRILLRLHLAPDREAKYWTRAHGPSGGQKRKTGRPAMDRKKWKSRVKSICDRLAREIDRGTSDEQAIGAILARVETIASQRPASIQTSIPNIECRLAEMEGHEDIDESNIPNQEEEDGEDEEDEDEGDQDQDDNAMVIDGDDVKHKEPSRARLRSLQAVLKMLVESPKITADIDANWVRKSAFSGNEFSENECQTVAYLANQLRPYIPKRRPREDGKGFQDPLPHVALRVAIVMIANSALRAAGYPRFTRRISPQTSSATLHGLHLGPVGLYETFCSQGERQFDVQDASGRPLTNYLLVQSSPANARALFESFFDMQKIERICGDHGLSFRNRITFVDRWTIRLSGRVIANGENRKGYPFLSMYEERKRLHAHSNTWVNKYIASGMSEEDVNELAEKNEAATKQLDGDIKSFRKTVKERQAVQSDISRLVRFGGSSYQELHSARVLLRDARKELIPREEALRNQRQVTYYYNKMSQAAKSCQNHSQEPSSTTKKFTVPTWEQPAVEDSCEHLDLSKLIDSNNRAVVYAGTDYGICKMSETVAMGRQELDSHLNRFAMLYGRSTNSQDAYPETRTQLNKSQSLNNIDHPDSQSHGSDGMDMQETNTQGSMKITAGLLSNISHTSAMLSRRQRRLRGNDEFRNELQNISEASKTLQSSVTMESIDAVQTIRRDARETLRKFEWSHTQRKDKHNQELRSKRGLSKICAAERRFVQKKHNRDGVSSSLATHTPDPVDGWCEGCLVHHINHSPEAKEFTHSPVCPRTAPRVMPVMFIGAAGTGVGSRIKGHERRGGKKLRQEHARYCPVAITDEFNTSKVCVNCFRRLQYARSRRIVKGKVKTVAMKGSQECVNPECVSFLRGHTIRARDVESAAAIAIAGASTLFHPERRRLPPFSRDPPITTNNTSV